MTGLNTSLCEEEITYRNVENFKIRQSYLNIGLVEFLPDKLRVKFKLCDYKDLGRFRHSLVVNLVFNYRSWGYLW